MTPAQPTAPEATPAAPPGGGYFRVAWLFFALSALLGLFLRVLAEWPLAGARYGYWLHAHSHIAFLGWVYNAFYALAVALFAPRSDGRFYHRLFWLTQVAVAGMLVTFPFQGYARESILFSTLHLVCAGLFGWRLLQTHRATPTARRYLLAAFACLFASALGPLALGPLAAADLRDSPWYPFAIYTYLHFQYNGWFILFLLACLYQHAGGRDRAAERAFPWLVAGTGLTLALSALWMQPPAAVRLTGLAGATAQLVGAAYLLRSLRSQACFRSAQRRRVAALARVAAAALAAKWGLQFIAGWPAAEAVAIQRPAIIGFLHLIFLGAVSPMLIGWALELGWWRWRRLATAGLAIYAAGALTTEVVLLWQPLAAHQGWPLLPHPGGVLLAAAALLALGVLGLGLTLDRRTRHA